jgi:hypothetical protein
MRTILAMALAANIVFSAGANYLQGALVSQADAVSNTGNVLVSTASQPAKESSAF